MNIKKLLAEQRYRVFIGYNTVGPFGIGLVIAKTVQDIIRASTTGHYEIPMWILYPLGVGMLWLGGYVYQTTGMYGEEQEFNSQNNPYFKRHLEGIKSQCKHVFGKILNTDGSYYYSCRKCNNLFKKEAVEGYLIEIKKKKGMK